MYSNEFLAGDTSTFGMNIKDVESELEHEDTQQNKPFISSNPLPYHPNTYFSFLPKYGISKNELDKLYQIISCDKSLNPHIFDIFNIHMIHNLYKFHYSYNSLVLYVIDGNEDDTLITDKITTFYQLFKDRQFVLDDTYDKLCHQFHQPNIYFSTRKRGKVLSDQQAQQHKLNSRVKYEQSDKAKARHKRYNDKRKLNLNI